MLVKEGSVGTDKAGSLRSVPSVVAHAVRLHTDNGMQFFIYLSNAIFLFVNIGPWNIIGLLTLGD